MSLTRFVAGGAAVTRDVLGIVSKYVCKSEQRKPRNGDREGAGGRGSRGGAE